MSGSMATWGNDLYTGRRSYNIVGKSRIWFTIAITAVLASVVLLLVRGLQPGIEFRGGSEFTIANPATTSQQIAIDTLATIDSNAVPKVSTVGSNSLRIQTSELSAEQVEEAKVALAEAYGVEPADITTSFVGPAWGADVTTKAIQGLVVFLLLVMVVMTVYFRNWRMAAAAIIALFHDLAVTVGIYALVGWEVTPATAIGLLTILGYSIYDTVVVFDKVRENTAGFTDQTRATYGEKANLAVNQTLVRSINTSVVALLPVAAILFVGSFILGAGTLRDIALALFVGMLVGSASSIFLATPLEVWLRNREKRVRDHTAKVLQLRGKREATTGEAEPVTVGALLPGSHQGIKAQPKRKKRN